MCKFRQISIDKKNTLKCENNILHCISPSDQYLALLDNLYISSSLWWAWGHLWNLWLFWPLVEHLLPFVTLWWIISVNLEKCRKRPNIRIFLEPILRCKYRFDPLVYFFHNIMMMKRNFLIRSLILTIYIICVYVFVLNQ